MIKSTNEAIEIAKYISFYFNTYILRQKTSSIHTIKSYKNSMMLYLEFLEFKGYTTTTLNYNCFSINMIESWLEWLLITRNNKPQTVNVRLSNLRIFLTFLGKQDIKLIYLEVEATRIPLRKCIVKKINGIDKQSIKDLFSAIDSKSLTGLRDLAIFTLIYNTATRLNEILSLKLQNLHLDCDKPYIVILGKGNKLRSLYISSNVVTILKKYLSYHFSKYNLNFYLFYSKINGYESMLSQTAIDKQLKKYAGIANKTNKEIPINLHSHQIRHSAASHWLEDGLNIVQISYLLGHEQLQTTMIYLKISDNQKEKALKMVNKLDDSVRLWEGNVSSLKNLI